MRRYFILFLTALFAAASILVAVTSARSSAETRVCQLWASKPYRHCIRYAPSPTTTTSTTTTLPPTTTEPAPDLSFCEIGSDGRQGAYNDALTYYAYGTNRDTVNFDANVFAYFCASIDPVLAAAAQVVVDCFATEGDYFLACGQPPEYQVGKFAAALEPTLIEPGDTTTTVDAAFVDTACRVNNPGRVHAINDVYAYEQTWAQPEADAVIADATVFITVCATYPGTDNLRHDARVLIDCLNGWVGSLPHFQACYMPGNEINYYLHDLLVSSQ